MVVKITEKLLEKVAEKAAEKTAEKIAEKTAEKTAEKAAEKGAEKTTEKTAEKTAEKAAEGVAEKTAETAVKKSTLKGMAIRYGTAAGVGGYAVHKYSTSRQQTWGEYFGEKTEKMGNWLKEMGGKFAEGQAKVGTELSKPENHGTIIGVIAAIVLGVGGFLASGGSITLAAGAAVLSLFAVPMAFNAMTKNDKATAENAPAMPAAPENKTASDSPAKPPLQHVDMNQVAPPTNLPPKDTSVAANKTQPSTPSIG